MDKDLIGALLSIAFIASFFISPIMMWAMYGINMAYLLFIAVDTNRRS